MPAVHGHVEAKRDLPEYATCIECHRTYRSRGEDQASMELLRRVLWKRQVSARASHQRSRAAAQRKIQIGRTAL